MNLLHANPDYLNTTANDWNDLICFLSSEVDKYQHLQNKPTIKEVLRRLDRETLIKIKASKGRNSFRIWNLTNILTLIESLITVNKKLSDIANYVTLAVTNKGPVNWGRYFEIEQVFLKIIGPEVIKQKMIRTVLTHPNLEAFTKVLFKLANIPAHLIIKEARLEAFKSIISYRPTNNDYYSAGSSALHVFEPHWQNFASKLNAGVDFMAIARVTGYMTTLMHGNEKKTFILDLLTNPAHAALFTPAVANALTGIEKMKYDVIAQIRKKILEIAPDFAPVTTPGSDFFPKITTLAIRDAQPSLAEKIKTIIADATPVSAESNNHHRSHLETQGKNINSDLKARIQNDRRMRERYSFASLMASSSTPTPETHPQSSGSLALPHHTVVSVKK